MANILRYHPADDAFDDLVRGYFMRPLRFDAAQPAQIKIDVSEDDKDYTVAAEIPGVKKEDIKVRIDGNQVTISAELKKEKEEREGSRLLRSERQYGFASRTFSLAFDVDEAKSAAKYENGILELTLPKKTTTSSKRLPIA